MQKAASGPVIPSGYVTDGLAFFLDGLQLVSASQWTDIVGGRTFELIDCVKADPGILFNGSTSKGLYNGAITGDWENETIEAAIAGTSGGEARCVLGQPYQNGSVGISLLLSAADRGKRSAVLGIDGAAHVCKWFASDSKTVSARAGLCVANKTVVSNTQNVTATRNETNTTTLGMRVVEDNFTLALFSGTIYAIRVYDRKLTEAEMIQNQQADIDRYGITI